MVDDEMTNVYEDHLRRLHAGEECACAGDADAQDAILADAERARQEAIRALALFFIVVLLGLLAVHIANKGGL